MVVSGIAQDLKIYRKINGKPRHETSALDILQDLFSEYELNDIKDELWEFLKDTLHEDCQDAGHRIFLFEFLSDLATASYLITKEHCSNKTKNDGSTPEQHTGDQD